LNEEEMIISRLSACGLALIRGSFLSSLLIWPPIAIAQSEGPFARFSGLWRGSGEVVGADGHREQIRCSAAYSISDNGDALTQTLVCASDSYRVEINTYVVAEHQNVEGHWEEKTRNISGHITGRIADGQFEGAVVGTGFTAELRLRSNGRKQNVTIRPHGGDIADVEVVLEWRNTSWYLPRSSGTRSAS
jgi:hypothetical protein